MNTEVRIGRRALAVALAATATTFAVPAVASASTASVAGGAIVYSGGSEANSLSVTYSTGSYLIDDPAAPARTPGPGCTVEGTKFRCDAAAVAAFQFDTGEGDDTLLNLTLTPTRVSAGAGNDTIASGGGNDTIDGGAGNDALNGGFGDDTFTADSGADLYEGSFGNDTVDYSARSAGVTVTLGGEANDGEPNEGDDLRSIGRVLGGSGNDVLAGSSSDETLSGGPGDDVLSGAGGADQLDGGAGVDTFDGGSGADVLRARDGVAESGSCGPDVDLYEIDAVDTLTEDCEGYVPGTTGTDGLPGSGTTAGGAAGNINSVFTTPIALTIDPRPAPFDGERGIVSVSVQCPAGLAAGCVGTVTLAIVEAGGKSRVVASRRRKLTRVGSKGFKVRGGARKTLPVRLSRRGRRSLAKRRRAKLQLTVALQTPAGTSVKTTTLTVERRVARKTKKPKKPVRGRR